MSGASKPVQVKLATESAETFLKNYGKGLASGWLVLPTKTAIAAGRAVQVVATLKTGEVLLEADGVVEAPSREHTHAKPTLRVRITSVSESGLALLSWMDEAPDADVLVIEPLPESFSERPPAFQFPPIDGPPSERRIGIDLGTAYTCAGYVENGACVLVPADKGRVSFPSAVYVQGDNFLVGFLALQRIETHPSHVVHSWKRLLGRRYDSAAVEDIRVHAGYSIEAGPVGEAAVKIDEILCHPSWFAARVLYEIRLRTFEHLGEVVDEAVITVPAHYTDPQRADVREAARMAGFQAIRMITEPVAAAIAYGVGRELEQTLLVYDFGGGTFDVSLIEVEGDAFQVVATGGDPFLGGVDFDDRIMGYLLVEFRKQTGINLASDPPALARLAFAAERAKRDLSEKSSTRVQLPFLAKTADGKGIPLDLEITREIFEGVSRDLIERSLAACDELLRHAGVSVDQIDDVVTVGGMSRMPLIQDSVKSHFGRAPRRGVNADEAVARGASLFASSLGEAGPMAILDVASLAVGILGADGEAFLPIIPTRAALPATRVYKFLAEREGQDDVRLDIYQGNAASIVYCDYLGTTVAQGLPPAPKGEVLAEIVFSMDEEGTIALALRDRDKTTRRLTLTFSAGRSRPAKLPGGHASDRGFVFLRRLLGGR